jgi:hypothetical protein
VDRGLDAVVAAVLFVVCSACSEAGDHRTEVRSADAGAAGEPAKDAAVPDVRAAAVAVLDQYDRASRLVCPCQVERGGFGSLDECIAKTGYDMTLIDCLSAAFAPFDSDELREQLRCQAQSVKTRNDCLASVSCAVAETSACFASTPQCPMFDAQVLTQVLRSCPGAAVLGR